MLIVLVVATAHAAVSPLPMIWNDTFVGRDRPGQVAADQRICRAQRRASDGGTGAAEAVVLVDAPRGDVTIAFTYFPAAEALLAFVDQVGADCLEVSPDHVR